MVTKFLVGDVYRRMAELPDHSFDLIITSPPFLALRSYLPDDHPQKHLEIGSEATPADYLDTLLALTAEWRRLLAPHGSLAVELGDTYCGSGGGGGDYYEGGFREGQPGFTGSASVSRDALREANARHWREKNADKNGWPLAKSLCGIPTLYAWSLAYGRNLLTGRESPAGQWRIRNLKAFIRSNPPVGALGDKERPATSYVVVACTGTSRFFDLDAVRTPAQPQPQRSTNGPKAKGNPHPGTGWDAGLDVRTDSAPGGAPPLDWWHPIDAIIDDELNQRNAVAGRPNGGNSTGPKNEIGNSGRPGLLPLPRTVQPARGVHIRRRLETAGYLAPQDFYDISPRGYQGSHYAVWPPELVRQLIDEMCPRRVCVEYGVPSRRLTEQTEAYAEFRRQVNTGRLAHASTVDAHRARGDDPGQRVDGAGRDPNGVAVGSLGAVHRSGEKYRTVGWSDCGHNNWRPGRILDPFVGSGTTLAVASGMGRDSVGIDLDSRNAHLAEQRVGMFLEVDWGERGPTSELPPPEIVDAVEDAGLDPTFHRREQPDEVKHNDGRQPRRKGPRPIANVSGQEGLL